MSENSQPKYRVARFLLSLLCFAAFCGSADAWSDWSHKYNDAKPISGERDYILRIFDFYSQLEQNFEKDGGEQRSRDLVEDYTEVISLPACARCVKLLNHGHDIELMLAYFRLLQFTQNSAEESFSLYLGDIFVANPRLVEDAFPKLTPEQQCIGYAQLEWGFDNVTYGKKPTAATKYLQERLNHLKPSCK